METFSKIKQFSVEGSGNKRRDFLKKGIIVGALTGITYSHLVSGSGHTGGLMAASGNTYCPYPPPAA